MSNITVSGNQSYFNEDAKFFKDLYVYGNLYYNFQAKEKEIFGDIEVTGNITGNLIGNVTGNTTGSHIGNVTATTITATDSITLTTKPFFRNVPTIAADYTVTTDYNEMSIGPITINSGITVTVNSGATWTVV
jgi:hypothetical protein